MFGFRFHNHVDSVIDALHRIVARSADVLDQAGFIQGSDLLRKHDKTYIFSNLSPDVYDTYLNIWGNLTIETNDNLYDYLYNFIKA